MPETPARLADRYRLTETLGRGGMGEVWRAYDERLNRYCAIKVLRQMEDVPSAERFSREARTLASLRHPGVVTVYDYGVDAGRPYLVMELLPGPSLAELLRDQGPLEIDAVRRYGAQAAAALQAVHDAAVVHRDIKPANLVLDTTGAVRLVDFGIALGSTFESTLTEYGAIIGSAAYLAPEQATGGRASARSDLYGFGCMLTTLLTGRPPFPDDSPVETLGRHLSEAPERPSVRRPEVPADLDSLVLDLLAKEPTDRPANAAEVARRLGGGRPARTGPGPVPMPMRTFGGIGPAAEGPNGRGDLSGTTATLTPPPPPVSHASRGTPGGARVLVAVLAVLTVLALAVAGWALTRSDNGTAPAPTLPVPTQSASPAPKESATARHSAEPSPSEHPLTPPPLLPLPTPTPTSTPVRSDPPRTTLPPLLPTPSSTPTTTQLAATPSPAPTDAASDRRVTGRQ
ncbi:MAG TPA: serine/threonine-protein kinase [Sporichthyaceae bacterium]|nr:serine/threonine-protein kinase [Sporichthyaceae bacterium]